MCGAIRTSTHREIRTLVPMFSKSGVVVSGGQQSCEHWWRNPQQSGKTWGFELRSIIIPLRAMLIVGAAVLVTVAFRKRKQSNQS